MHRESRINKCKVKHYLKYDSSKLTIVLFMHKRLKSLRTTLYLSARKFQNLEYQLTLEAKAIAVHSEKYSSVLNFYLQNYDKAGDIANNAWRENLRDVATLKGESTVVF